MDALTRERFFENGWWTRKGRRHEGPSALMPVFETETMAEKQARLEAVCRELAEQEDEDGNPEA